MDACGDVLPAFLLKACEQLEVRDTLLCSFLYIQGLKQRLAYVEAQLFHLIYKWSTLSKAFQLLC